jgi:prepilin-type N-terminal cleavage/methylation domain-containing protein
MTRCDMNKLRFQGGFTLIELMIVVVIIGILAAMAIPRFSTAVTRNKQAEAQLILKQIYVNERTYRQQGNTYYIPAGPASAAAPQVFRDIWVDIMAAARYTYTITGDANTFTATATSGILDDDASVDIWTIDNMGVLTCTSDDSQT